MSTESTQQNYSKNLPTITTKGAAMDEFESAEELERFVQKTFQTIIEKYQLRLKVRNEYRFFLFHEIYALDIASDRESFEMDYVENYGRIGLQMISFRYLTDKRKMPLSMSINFGLEKGFDNCSSLRVLAYKLEHYCHDLLSGDKSWINRDKFEPDPVPAWLRINFEGKLLHTK
jgi:hypothetical protein